ncbi:MAG TPA: hypothetical protein VFW87_21085 [Pirellulales bacterium]|nr:hypothetical protein [Pirellulales bacterium]
MTILLVTSDLACVANVSGAAKRAGHELRTAMSVAAMDDKLADARLVILDLNLGGLNLVELVPWLRSRLPAGAAIWAFGPHVHESKLADASAAGCERVLARGQFYARLDALLAEFE